MSGVVVSAIVLAGGRASRFGGPKLASPVAGMPLLHRSILAAAAASDEVVVVARPGDTPDLPSAPVPLRVVHDPEPDGGPLVGAATGLRAAAGERALVIGGDMPRLNPAVLDEMLRLLGAGRASAVVLAAPSSAAPTGRRDRPPRQPLPMAVRAAAALAAAEAAVASGRRSLQALLDAVSTVELPAAAWLRLDPAGGTLDDVDEPADVERLDVASIERPGT